MKREAIGDDELIQKDYEDEEWDEGRVSVTVEGFDIVSGRGGLGLGLASGAFFVRVTSCCHSSPPRREYQTEPTISLPPDLKSWWLILYFVIYTYMTSDNSTCLESGEISIQPNTTVLVYRV